jgi:hypothetical protein
VNKVISKSFSGGDEKCEENIADKQVLSNAAGWELREMTN